MQTLKRILSAGLRVGWQFNAQKLGSIVFAVAILAPAIEIQAATLSVNGTTFTETGTATRGPDSPGILVTNDGIYQIFGGDVTVNNTGGNDIGIQLGESGGSSGHFEMTSGSFTSRETQGTNSGTHGYGMITYSNSTFDISGGTFTATETGRGHNYIIQMFDNSTGTISQADSLNPTMLVGTETVNGNGKGVEINDNASLVVTGGNISHSSRDLNGSSMFILNSNDYLTGESSTLDVSGGTFDLFADGGLNLTVFNVNHGSVATMSGGEVTAVTTNGTKYLAQIKHEAQFILSGGQFPDGLLIEFNDNAVDEALVTIYGSDFEIDGNATDLGLITANTGTLTGVLEDGNDFSLNFDQNGNTGRIMLATNAVAAVPEPASLAVWMAFVALVGVRRLRRGKKRGL